MGGSRQLDGVTADRGTPRRVVPVSADRDQALAVLFDTHYRTLVAAAWFIVDDRETAEEIVMEAFVHLHRRWARLRDPGQAHRYLRSRVLDGARRRLRRAADRRSGR